MPPRQPRNSETVLLTNVVMLGAFTAVSDILAPDVILDKLLTMVDTKFREADSHAFTLGRSLISGKGGVNGGLKHDPGK